MAGAMQDLFSGFAERDAAAPEAFPAANLAALFEAGIIAAPFPPSMGGAGMNCVDTVEAIRAVATASPSTALIASMPLGLATALAAPPGLVPETHRTAWLEQVERIAADYRAARLYAACNSEKGAGGALDSIKTRAAISATGARLSGDKILATGGRFASTFFSTALVEEGALPGSGKVEFFLAQTDAPGVTILNDWDGFGMRSTESQSVRYDNAAADLLGFPNFILAMQPVHQFYLLFAAVPLGCAAATLAALSHPAPSSPALRLRLSEAQMRYEALQAYLRETARDWHFQSSPSYRLRVVRTKTYVTQEATKLTAELFALSGGRHYRRTSPVARNLADSFAGTALRPPLPLGLDTLVEQFEPFEA